MAASAAAALAPNRGWFTVTVPNIFAVRPPYQADEADPSWQGARVVEYRRLGHEGGG